ncbi:MAG: cytidine deaminase [Desulfobacterales bacterium]|jgi:cytidine deaminase
MKSSKTDGKFDQFLQEFPPLVRESLQSLLESGGMLTAEHCRHVMNVMEISADTLMQRLLPMAGFYCAAAVSGFKVGAVARARMSDNADDVALFLGGNIEFPALALTRTIHAEQSAVINAWLQGATQVKAIAVSAAPCGFCRQFLYELEGSPHVTILFYNQGDRKPVRTNLLELLPAAFGPNDLGSKAGLMASNTHPAKLNLKFSVNDPFVLEAVTAARISYAPYTQNIAGCAIRTAEGRIYTGRSAENAAFNPSLSALHTAIIQMALGWPAADNKIDRVALVERPTAASQRADCELLLQTLAPGITLEYFEAE